MEIAAPPSLTLKFREKVLDVKAPTIRDTTRSFYQSHSREYANATVVRALAEALRDFCQRLPSDGGCLTSVAVRVTTYLQSARLAGSQLV
jgi:hypothetical protein